MLPMSAVSLNSTNQNIAFKGPFKPSRKPNIERKIKQIVNESILGVYKREEFVKTKPIVDESILGVYTREEFVKFKKLTKN